MIELNCDEYREAKELYFSYECSYYFMDLDGTNEKYEKYNVPKECENLWNNEYLLLAKKHIAVASGNELVKWISRLTHIAYKCGDENYIEDIINIIWIKHQNLDTFSTMVLCEIVFNVINKRIDDKSIPKELYKQWLAKIYSSLKHIQAETITIDKSYTRDIRKTKAPAILARIARDLAEITDYIEKE